MRRRGDEGAHKVRLAGDGDDAATLARQRLGGVVGVLHGGHRVDAFRGAGRAAHGHDLASVATDHRRPAVQQLLDALRPKRGRACTAGHSTGKDRHTSRMLSGQSCRMSEE